MSSPYLFTFPAHGSPGYGWLTVAEGAGLPFAVKRVYWISQVPSGQVRGRHLHRTLEQVLVAVSGAVQVTVEEPDGTRHLFQLTHERQALYLPPGMWREIVFGAGAVLLALASQEYNEADCVRD